eukprot:scaffold61963_cov49-Attheya_sp.AAC.1
MIRVWFFFVVRRSSSLARDPRKPGIRRSVCSRPFGLLSIFDGSPHRPVDPVHLDVASLFGVTPTADEFLAVPDTGHRTMNNNDGNSNSNSNSRTIEHNQCPRYGRLKLTYWKRVPTIRIVAHVCGCVSSLT